MEMPQHREAFDIDDAGVAKQEGFNDGDASLAALEAARDRSEGAEGSISVEACYAEPEIDWYSAATYAADDFDVLGELGRVRGRTNERAALGLVIEWMKRWQSDVLSAAPGEDTGSWKSFDRDLATRYRAELVGLLEENIVSTAKLIDRLVPCS